MTSETLENTIFVRFYFTLCYLMLTRKRMLFRARVRHFESRGVSAREADCGKGQRKGHFSSPTPSSLLGVAIAASMH